MDSFTLQLLVKQPGASKMNTQYKINDKVKVHFGRNAGQVGKITSINTNGAQVLFPGRIYVTDTFLGRGGSWYEDSYYVSYDLMEKV